MNFATNNSLMLTTKYTNIQHGKLTLIRKISLKTELMRIFKPKRSTIQSSTETESSIVIYNR